MSQLNFSILFFFDYFLKNFYFSKLMNVLKDLNSDAKYIIYIHDNYTKFIVCLLLYCSISIYSTFNKCSLLCTLFTIKTPCEYEILVHFLVIICLLLLFLSIIVWKKNSFFFRASKNKCKITNFHCYFLREY